MALKLLFPPSLGELKASARAELLESSLSRRLGKPVLVEVARSYEELERHLLADEVELAWTPPALCAKAEPTARSILKAIRAGRSTYRSALVVRAGEASHVGELAGKRAAWVDKLSTAGYLLPVSHLRLLGHEPDELFGSQSYLGSYRDALRAVATGQADVSAVYLPAVDDATFRHALAQHVTAGEVEKLSCLGTTDEVPNDGLVITARVGPGEASDLQAALLSLTDGTRGSSLLLEVCDAQGFLVARPGDYRPLRAAFRAR